MKVPVIPVITGAQSIGKVTGRVGNRRKCWEHQNSSITMIGQNS